MIVSFFKIDSRQFDTSEATRLAQSIEEAGRVGRALLFFPEGIPDSRRSFRLKACVARRNRRARGISTPDPVETLVRAGSRQSSLKKRAFRDPVQDAGIGRSWRWIPTTTGNTRMSAPSCRRWPTNELLAPWVSGFDRR